MAEEKLFGRKAVGHTDACHGSYRGGLVGGHCERQCGHLGSPAISQAHVQLVGQYWLWSLRRLRERPRLPRLGGNDGDGPARQQAGRCSTLFIARREATLGLFQYFLRSGNGGTGGLEE